MSDQVCRHGGLARKCEQCEQEQAASELRQAALDGQAALDERDAEITRLRAENERLRGAVRDHENDSACLAENQSVTETVTALREENLQLREAMQLAENACAAGRAVNASRILRAALEGTP